MATLSMIPKSDFSTVFAADVKDTSTSAIAAGGLDPNPDLRTIFIGLGGTGVKTINAIKGSFQKRFKPTWSNYVGFLGIDASWTELDNAAYLTPSEYICETVSGVTNRMSNPATYPSAVRPFMPDGTSSDDAPHLGDLSSDGCGMTRLVGKIKIHDKDPDGNGQGMDEQIVNRIRGIMTSLRPLPPATPGNPPVKYDVYVIGSGSGGTNSGGFLEMPALIKVAMVGPVPQKLNANDICNINGILYLPDTLTQLVPTAKATLEANGYATLKELNYFQGVEMRPGYPESWTYGDTANPTIKMDSMFKAVYLIGSPMAAAADASTVAREVISEFLVSLLVDATAQKGNEQPFVTSALQSNTEAIGPKTAKTTAPDQPDKEAVGEAHEFNRSYAAIGFGQASAPTKLIQAYEIQQVCEAAGLKPVDPVTRGTLAANGTAPLPFRAIDDMFNATVGTEKAKEVIAPLLDIHSVISNGSFDFIKDLNLDPKAVTWSSIKANTYSNAAFSQMIAKYIEDKTSPLCDQNMQNEIIKRYAKYKENVLKFVKAEGPFAFYNLFKGNFIPVGNDRGIGIESMLHNIVEAQTFEGKGDFSRQNDVKNAQDNVSRKKQAIDTSSVLNVFNHQSLANEWIRATNAWVTASINEKRAKAAYRNTGHLFNLFLAPAMILADQIKTFGDIAETLADIYHLNGSPMNAFNSFAASKDKSTELNIGSLNTFSYNWLKRQADNNVAMVNAANFRDELVDEFFNAPDKWLDIPDGVITQAGAQNVLLNPDNPVPARRYFDEFAKAKVPQNINVSIGALFEQLNANGQDYSTTAQSIINSLNQIAQLRFNGGVNQQYVHRYIQYPSSLNTLANGPAIVGAIVTAAQNIGINANNVYASSDTDSILMYNQASNIEVYRIAHLPAWQAQYEAQIAGANYYGHGKSPDVEKCSRPDGSLYYKETTPWRDYPSIVINGSGSSREAELLEKEKAFVKEARDLGLLYSAQNNNGGWDIWRVSFEDFKPDSFNIVMCTPDPITGLIPQGKELSQTVAGQNGKSFSQICRMVRLEMAGIFSASATTEQAAWDKAARILRSHQPMHREIRRSMELMRDWNDQVKAFNDEVHKKRRPGMMMWLLKAGTLHKNEAGAWVLEEANGNVSMVANYSQTMLQFISPAERYNIANGLLGYELFKKLDAKLPGSLLDSEMDRAKEMFNMFIQSQDMTSLNNGQAMFDVVDGERLALEAMGANDGSAPIPFPYRTAMLNKKFNMTDQQLLDIAAFYHGTSVWSNL